LTRDRRHRRGLRFQFQPGLANLFQTLLAALQFLRQLATSLSLAVLAIFLRIHALCLAHQFRDLLHQLRLRLEHPVLLMALCLEALAFTLVPSRATRTRLTIPAFWQEPQELNEQTAEGIEVAEAKVADPAEIQLLVPRQHPKRQILVTGPIDLVPPARWPAAR
jgi:hypothetical protein